MLLLNPRRRKRRAGSKSRRRAGRRKMSALQLKYFGKRRSAPRRRRHSSARRARRSAVVIHANPSRRRRRRGSSVRRAFSSVRRRFRRNPIGGASVRASLGYVVSTAKNALAGGAGAVIADLAYGQVLQRGPADLVAKIGSRYNADGGCNFAYYGAKLGLATALGVLAAKFAPGSVRGFVARGVEGAYTVSAYEIMRLMMPANVAMGAYTRRTAKGIGYNNPARVLPTRGMSAYTGRRLAGLNGGAGSAAGSAMPANSSYADGRIGEASVRSSASP